MIYLLSIRVVVVYYINRSDLVSCVIYKVLYFYTKQPVCEDGLFFYGSFWGVVLIDLGAPGAHCR